VQSPAGKKVGCIPSLFVIVFVFVIIGGMIDGPKPSPSSAPQAAAPRVEDARKKEIKGGFSPWDGSHIALEKLIKSAMHNPDSYKHVKTVFREEGNALVVTTQYRGTNGFGAVVTNQVTARAGLACNVIEVIK
jgi:hypothetical protein